LLCCRYLGALEDTAYHRRIESGPAQLRSVRSRPIPHAGQ
jgi:hypothetical protein